MDITSGEKGQTDFVVFFFSLFMLSTRTDAAEQWLMILVSICGVPRTQAAPHYSCANTPHLRYTTLALHRMQAIGLIR